MLLSHTLPILELESHSFLHSFEFTQFKFLHLEVEILTLSFKFALAILVSLLFVLVLSDILLFKKQLKEVADKIITNSNKITIFLEVIDVIF